MLKDAQRNGALTIGLFNPDLFNALPTDDVEESIDPYTPEERELILAGFWNRRRHYHAFVFHQFWTGARPSEAYDLRRIDVDLSYGWEKIQKSFVEGQ
jgi:integrase